MPGLPEGKLRAATAMNHVKPTVVDLFAGAGLFGHAFEREGFEVVRAVEIDRVAAATHRANMPCRVDVADIRTIKPEGHCDVLIGGPPCQGFSTLGKRRSDDPRNFLCMEIARWARRLQPNVVVIENVAAFVQSPAHELLLKHMKKLGYETAAIVIDAVEFGVPQHRRRSFTFASRLGIPSATRLPGHHPRTVREAWDGLPSRPTGENWHLAPTPSKLAHARMTVIPPGGDKRDIMQKLPRLSAPSWWRTHAEVTDVWGRLEWDRPSNTLRTCLLNPSKGRYIHPDQHRVMSIREAARLHSISDRWQFIGTPYQVARQIGNSVPLKLGRSIARGVRQLLL